MPGKGSTTDIFPPTPGPLWFWFLTKVYLFIENSSNQREIRKRFCVLRPDSGMWSGSRPGPGFIYSLPTRLLSVPSLPARALFIWGSQRLGLKSPGSP